MKSQSDHIVDLDHLDFWLLGAWSFSWRVSVDTDETAELRHSIHRYQNLLADCTDAETKVVLQEFIAELEKKLARPSGRRVAAQWPSRVAY